MRKNSSVFSSKNKKSTCAVGKYVAVRAISLILVLIVALSSTFVFAAANEEDTNITKVNRRYEIAVVYDNSGSMYMSKAWCYAKYSMEIFASMLNYSNGDKLLVFPMWEVSTDGKAVEATAEPVESSGSIQVNSPDEVKKISNMYTLNADGTPITQVDNAYNYLLSVPEKEDTITEKWLVVITDGEFNDDEGRVLSPDAVRDHLASKATDGIRVQYLGFDGAKTLKSDESNGFYSKTSKASTLRKDLTDICNEIFRRAILSKSYLNSKNLKLGISMRKLIVFVQGKNAEIVSLEQKATGKKISVVADSGKIQYSKLGAANYKKAPYDDSLYGQVVTFDACEAGDYILNYKGATEIQIFYEPDVDIDITVKNEKGEEVTPESDNLYPGKYSVEYAVIDRMTRKDVVDSPLMGENGVEDLVCNAEITRDGKTQIIENFKSGDEVDLKAGDSLFLNISAKYLEDYTITTKENIKGSTFNIKDFPDTPEFKVDVDVLQDKDWYTLADREKWEPIKVGFSLGGEPLTDEQVAAIAPTIVIEPQKDDMSDLPFMYKVMSGESALAVYIAKDENGKDTEPEPDTGKYKLTATASCLDENGQTSNEDDDSDKFTISKFPSWLPVVAGLLGLLALLIAAFIISRIPAYPKKVVIQEKVGVNEWEPENGIILHVRNYFSATDLDGDTIFSGDVSKTSTIGNRGKTNASFQVKITEIMAGVERMSIDGQEIKVAEEPEVKITNETMIVARRRGIDNQYRILINPRN
ncbi:MAG: hypothetical protein IJE14_03340 [Clostridia bacterium]|nr:hypothetical protein [Clostridia bacterium]